MKFLRSTPFLFILACLVFFILGYKIDRVEHKYFVDPNQYFALLLGGISLFWLSIQLSKRSFTLQQLMLMGIGIRLISLWAAPNLSDDYFRYLWDGNLINLGINPFDFLPSELINTQQIPDTDFYQTLYQGFNSQDYYSVYPPFVQFVFSISAFLGGDSIYMQMTVLRIFVILAEVGAVYFLIKILQETKSNINLSLLYILNPLILLEFSLNLHTEVFMVVFILGGILYVKRDNWFVAALFWAFAISAKLLPLMFLPLFFKHLQFKKSVYFYVVTLAAAALTFLPFYNDTLFPHIKNSIDLYFGTFQFNGSLVYVLNFLGKSVLGFDITYFIMPLFSKLFMLSICLYGLIARYKSDQGIWRALMYFYLVYLILAATVHPWYITLFVPLSIILHKGWGINWSMIVLLTYATYFTSTYTEYSWIIILEYGMLFIMIWDQFYPIKSMKNLFDRFDYFKLKI